MKPAILEARNLAISFGGLKAVADVSLTVAAGSLTALIGPNGAGKSTLFAMISGFLAPDAGTVHFDGRLRQACHPTRSAGWAWRAPFRSSSPSRRRRCARTSP